MTTIVLNPSQRTLPAVPGFCRLRGAEVHHVFALQEVCGRDEAEDVARQMMENFEADHFRRVIEVGQRIG